MNTSPTPWEVFRSPDGMDTLAVIMDANDGLVGETPCGDAQSMANAALIVEAVNAYEGLKADNTRRRKALEVAIAALQEAAFAMPDAAFEPKVDMVLQAIDTAKAALGGEG